MKKNLYVLLSLLVLASIVLAACGGGAAAPATEAPASGAATEASGAATEAPASTEPKTATGAWSQEPDNIIPYFTQMSYAIWIAQLTMVGLGEWDDQGNFVAELAAEVPTPKMVAYLLMA